MDKFLIKIIETIDNLDANINIKDCYKEMLELEFMRIDEVYKNYKKDYNKIINKFLEDY